MRKLKWPLSSVVTSCVVPLMCTVAPAKGSFVDLSSTLPDKVILLCANDTEANNKMDKKGERRRPQLVFDMSDYLTDTLKWMSMQRPGTKSKELFAMRFAGFAGKIILNSRLSQAIDQPPINCDRQAVVQKMLFNDFETILSTGTTTGKTRHG